MDWATGWAIFSKTHLVTLLGPQRSTHRGEVVKRRSHSLSPLHFTLSLLSFQLAQWRVLTERDHPGQEVIHTQALIFEPNS
jgi:hypothetical protein